MKLMLPSMEESIEEGRKNSSYIYEQNVRG